MLPFKMLPLEMANCDTMHEQTTPKSVPSALDAHQVDESGEAHHAAARCFAVPEMLEHILSFLPFKDLLLAQAVSKTIQDAISSSLKLRNKLHLVADPESAFCVLPVIPRFFTLRRTMPFADVEALGLIFDGTFDLTDVNGRETCSWRDLFLTQPPVKTIGAWLSCSDRMCVGGPDCEALHVEQGITLGSMADWARNCVPYDKHYTLANFEKSTWTDHFKPT